jgi:monoamine oxidase
MAKSRILSAIQRIARDYRIAEQHNVSVATVAEWREDAAQKRRESGVSRRQLLGGAVAAAGVLALPGRARAARQPTIAIVGGGIAGLSCALQLADQGLAATVYEANSRIGGRMHTNFDYFNEGQTAEWCGELIDTNHQTIRSLAKRFGLDVVDIKQAEPNGSEDTFYFFGQYYPRSQANTDFQAVHHEVTDAIQAAGASTTYATSTPAGRDIDNTTLYDWIEEHVPGGHDSPMGAMLDVAYTEELAVSTTVQSALNMIYLLGFNPTPGNFEMFGISDERFHIAGGNQQLPNSIASYLGVGTTVKTGWSMTAIARNPDGRFTLSFDVGPSAKTVVADYVVMCIPFSILRDLNYKKAGFDALKNTTIQTLGAGKSGKLQLQFGSRFWNQSGPWPGVSNGNSYSDTGYQNSWDVTRAQAGVSGIMVDYTGGPVSAAMVTKLPYAVAGERGVLTDAQTFLGRLEPVFPGATRLWNGKVASSLPHLDPFLKLSYSHWEVGQYQTIAGYEAVRQGNCLFAGEHTSLDFQGFMEGGAFSGQRAANEILADLK